MVTYSVVARTNIKVLEIGQADFKKNLTPEYLRFLEEISCQRHLLKLQRIKAIIRASKNMHHQQDFSFFYERCLNTLVQLHPGASAKIIRGCSQDMVLKGKLETKSNFDRRNFEISTDTAEETTFNSKGELVIAPKSRKEPKLEVTQSLSLPRGTYKDQPMPDDNKYMRMSYDEKRMLAFTVMTADQQIDLENTTQKVHPLQQWRNATVDKYVEHDGQKIDMDKYCSNVTHKGYQYFNREADRKARIFADNMRITVFGSQTREFSESPMRKGECLMPPAKLFRAQPMSRVSQEKLRAEKC